MSQKPQNISFLDSSFDEFLIISVWDFEGGDEMEILLFPVRAAEHHLKRMKQYSQKHVFSPQVQVKKKKSRNTTDSWLWPMINCASESDYRAVKIEAHGDCSRALVIVEEL